MNKMIGPDMIFLQQFPLIVKASQNSGDFEISFGFAGGLHDRDTCLVRFGYRDYAPDVGRWTAKDLILFAGGNTDLYRYVLNNPVNLLDPFGLETLPVKSIRNQFINCLWRTGGWGGFAHF